AALANRAGVEPRGPAALPAYFLGLAVAALVLGVPGNQLSRQVEASADTFALQLTHDPRPLLPAQPRPPPSPPSPPHPPPPSRPRSPRRGACAHRAPSVHPGSHRRRRGLRAGALARSSSFATCPIRLPSCTRRSAPRRMPSGTGRLNRLRPRWSGRRSL